MGPGCTGSFGPRLPRVGRLRAGGARWAREDEGILKTGGAEVGVSGREKGLEKETEGESAKRGNFEDEVDGFGWARERFTAEEADLLCFSNCMRRRRLCRTINPKLM